ncbi:MAG: hypothetical protein AAF495_22150 [Pseudomonadota bacterium]
MTDSKDDPAPNPARNSLASSVYGALGIGLMVGALLGLAKSAVVGAFIGAVGTALAAMLGLNDKHFSTAKAVRIGTFGFAVLVAAPTSLYVRDHGLLTPQPAPPPSNAELLAEYIKLGFDKEEALALLGQSIPKQAEQRVASAVPQKSYLHSSATNPSTCDDLATLTADGDVLTLTESFGTYVSLDEVSDKKWRPLLDGLGELPTEEDRKGLLFLARDADCARGSFSQRVAFADELCADFAATKPDLAAGAQEKLPADQREAVRARLTSDLTAEARGQGFGLLVEFLCR